MKKAIPSNVIRPGTPSPKIGEEKEGVEGGNKIKEIRRRGKCKQEEPTVAELHSTPRCGIIVWGKTAAKWPLPFWVWTIPDTLDYFSRFDYFFFTIWRSERLTWGLMEKRRGCPKFDSGYSSLVNLNCFNFLAIIALLTIEPLKFKYDFNHNSIQCGMVIVHIQHSALTAPFT